MHAVPRRRFLSSIQEACFPENNWASPQITASSCSDHHKNSFPCVISQGSLFGAIAIANAATDKGFEVGLLPMAISVLNRADVVELLDRASAG